MKHKYYFFALLISYILLPYLSNAQQFDPNKVYRLTNLSGGGVLEIGGGGTQVNERGATANMWPYAGHANQEWYIESRNDGIKSFFTFVNRASRYTLEVGGDGAQLLAEGRRCNQWNYTAAPKQQWKIYQVQDNGAAGIVVEIENINSGKLLSTDDNNRAGMPVYQGGRRTNATINSQRWAIVEAGPSGNNYAGLGTFSIASASANSAETYKIIEVGASSVEPGGGINIWENNRTANQQWVIQQVNNGLFVFRNRLSTLALSISGSSQEQYNPEQAIQQQSYSGGGNQLWSIVDANGITYPNGTAPYRIISYLSGQALTISSSSKIVQSYSNGRTGQNWQLNYVALNRSAVITSTTPSQQTSSNIFSVYPNPGTSTIKLSIEGVSKFNYIKITDVRGVLIKSTFESNGQVDINDVAAGTYIITASDGKTEYHKKLVKQ